MKHNISLFDIAIITNETDIKDNFVETEGKVVRHTGRLCLFQKLPSRVSSSSLVPKQAVGGERPNPTCIPVKENKTKRSAKPASPMDAFCFTDIFTPLSSISPEDTIRLYDVYAAANYQMPARKELKDLSVSMRIPQTQIKKWFSAQQCKDNSNDGQFLQEPSNYSTPAKEFTDAVKTIEQRAKEFQNFIEKLQTRINSNANSINELSKN